MPSFRLVAFPAAAAELGCSATGGDAMGVSREQAINIAVRRYACDRVEVIRSRAELVGVRGDVVLVLTHATHSSAAPEFDVPGPQTGPGWWVAFEELQREPGGGWGPPGIHPSGGLVRVCEATGAVFAPTLL